MKLTELTRPTHLGHAASILRSHGYTSVSGGYGTVFTRGDQNYVLKLFGSEDHAYRAFVHMVRNNPNKHFPRFHGNYIRVSPEFYAVRMEKLDVFVDTRPYSSIQNLLAIYINDTYERSQGREPPINPSMQLVIDNAHKYVNSDNELKAACDLIVPMLYRYDLDLYHRSANLMLRGSTIVITDPLKINTDDDEDDW